jgi:hypothetical protein
MALALSVTGIGPPFLPQAAIFFLGDRFGVLARFQNLIDSLRTLFAHISLLDCSMHQIRDDGAFVLAFERLIKGFYGTETELSVVEISRLKAQLGRDLNLDT